MDASLLVSMIALVLSLVSLLFSARLQTVQHRNEKRRDNDIVPVDSVRDSYFTDWVTYGFENHSMADLIGDFQPPSSGSHEMMGGGFTHWDAGTRHELRVRDSGGLAGGQPDHLVVSYKPWGKRKYREQNVTLPNVRPPGRGNRAYF